MRSKVIGGAMKSNPKKKKAACTKVNKEYN
jgi:hypothetical protein